MEKVIIFSIFGFLFSLIGTKYLKEYLERKKVFDIPNERSSHTKPIPKGGGWIIVLCIIVVKFFSEGGFSLPSFAMYLSIIGLAILSWIDDIKNVRVITRLLFQFLIIFLLFFSITGAGFAVYTNFFVTLLFVWFINIFNFMDGIDGITPSVTITLILGVLVIRSLELYPTNWIFEFGIIFSCLAFLFWNWHPAKIFLGDVGSISLGFACGTLLLTPIIYGKWEVISLIMYYVLDTSLTLINRFMAGKKVWQAPRLHFSQHAVKTGLDHGQVVRHVLFVDLLLVALAVAAARGWGWASLICSGVAVSWLLFFLSGDHPARKE